MNMTEDDTFKKLRQVPFDQLNDVVDALSKEAFEELMIDSHKRAVFLEKYGWEYDKFEKECKKRFA